MEKFNFDYVLVVKGGEEIPRTAVVAGDDRHHATANFWQTLEVPKGLAEVVWGVRITCLSMSHEQ
jgi:hypothetical protein